MKRFLMSVLIAVMVVGLGSTAFAAAGDIADPAFSDIAGHEAEGALTLLGAMGVYTGDSGLGGAVNPDDPITRAQFCKVVVAAMGRGSTAAGLSGLQPTFTDGASIPSWAWGYVNVAVYMGVINGYPDGSFGANNPVTYAEAVTMLIRAVSGHAAQVGPGVWPYNYLFYGVDNGFTGGVDVGFANLPASRGDVARMLVAAMQIEKVDKDGAALEDTARLYPIEGTVTDIDYENAKIVLDGEISYGLADPVYLVGASDYEGLRNQPVWLVEDADGVYFIEIAGESSAITGVFKDVLDTNNDEEDDAILLADGTKVSFSGGDADVTLNKNEGYCVHSLTAGDELVIFLGDDGKVANVSATHFEDVDWITYFDASEDYDAEDTDTWTYVETYHDYNFSIPASCAVTLNGSAKTPDDLAESDAIQVAFSEVDGDPFIIRACREAVEGVVAGTQTVYGSGSTTYKVTIGDKTYTVNTTGGIMDSFPTKDAQVKFGLDFDGKLFVPITYADSSPIVFVKGASTETGSTTKYFITVDNKGVEQTYQTDDFDASGWVGCFYYLYIDGATGLVYDGDHFCPDWDADVVAVGADSVTLDDGEYYFAEDPIVYAYDEDSDSYTYVGLSGLSVDDYVGVQSDSDTWLLVIDYDD